MDFKPYIREISDWPVAGVSFKDITTLLENHSIFKCVIDEMIEPFSRTKIDKVVAIDARGFLFAAPIAYKIGCGLSLVRKEGKLPYKTIKESYQKEYGFDTLAIHEDSIKKGEKVLIVDDLMATGGSLVTAATLVERLGGEVIGISCVINLPFLGGSKRLSKYKQKWLVSYDEE